MMWWLLSLICFILGLVLGGWGQRRRLRLPLDRLQHVLQAVGIGSASSTPSAIEIASVRLQELTVQLDRVKRDLTLLQSVLGRTEDGIMVVDDDLQIVMANPAAGQIFERIGTQLEGHRVADVIREKQVYDGFRAALEQQEPFEGRFERIEGSQRKVFQLRIVPLEGGRVAGVFLDVTRLEHLARVRQEFLTNVSHELRTPLTAIRAYVETLLDGAIDDSENNVRFLEIIQKHTERLTSLVNDVSDLSAIESGHVQLNPTALNVREVVEEVMMTVQPQAHSSGVDLINDVSPEAVLTADRRRFEQIFLNLLENAVKFNHRGGEVRVKAELKDGEMTISVKDTGLGIPAAELPRVFERFYRVDKARSMDVGGTGLGLAIVKHLVRIQGGKISVESQPGEGTCFTIVWPDVASQELATA